MRPEPQTGRRTRREPEMTGNPCRSLCGAPDVRRRYGTKNVAVTTGKSVSAAPIGNPHARGLWAVTVF